jgi:4,4'-diaponeurosporenoate glycosyltransferase
VRMFPDGFAQLCESWSKAFADGAAANRAILTLAVLWLSALCTVFLLLCFSSWPLRAIVSILYFAAVAQVFSFARQVGRFSFMSALLFPIPLVFFFGLFSGSLLNRALRRQVTWRGRRV